MFQFSVITLTFDAVALHDWLGQWHVEIHSFEYVEIFYGLLIQMMAADAMTLCVKSRQYPLRGHIPNTRSI